MRVQKTWMHLNQISSPRTLTHIEQWVRLQAHCPPADIFLRLDSAPLENAGEEQRKSVTHSLHSRTKKWILFAQRPRLISMEAAAVSLAGADATRGKARAALSCVVAECTSLKIHNMHMHTGVYMQRSAGGSRRDVTVKCVHFFKRAHSDYFLCCSVEIYFVAIKSWRSWVKNRIVLLRWGLDLWSMSGEENDTHRRQVDIAWDVL